MSDDAKAAAVGAIIGWDGDEYVLKPLTVANYYEFEAWLEFQAWLGLERLKAKVFDGQIAEFVYKDMLGQVSVDCTTHQFSRGGEPYHRATRTVFGKKRLALLSFRQTHVGLDEDVVEQMFGNEVVAERIMTELVSQNQ